MLDHAQAAIVGAGPAGIATAIQLRRSGVDFTIFEENQIGGLLLNAHLIENYPGFPQGIAGPELAKIFRQQLERWEIHPFSQKVECVEYREGSFYIRAGHHQLACNLLVVASGTVAEKLSDPILLDAIEDRVFYEVYPLKDICGKHVAIVGAGDAAFDYAMNLSENNRVTMLCRDSDTSCLSMLSQRAKKTSSIEIRTHIRLKAIEKNQGQLTIQLIAERKPHDQLVKADFLLIAIGRSPSLDFLSPSVANNKEELILNRSLYFVGDVKNDRFRQAGICVGDGIKAAMQIYEKIKADQA